MKNKTGMIVLCFVLLAGFVLGATGLVQAASAAKAAGKDRLIGVLITCDHIDSFDHERFLEENIARLAQGREVPESRLSRYWNRIYATLIETETVDEETGERIRSAEYVFEDLDGIRLFTASFGEGEYKYKSVMADDAASDVKVHYNYTDGGTDIELCATIYLDGSRELELYLAGNCFYCINPVYLDSDGSVYVTAGDGFFPGGSFTYTLSETTSVNEHGVESETKTTVEIQLLWAPVSERVSVLQFDEKNELLERGEYLPGQLPERMEMLAETQYVIVETQTRDAEGNPGLERTLVQCGEESLSAFYAREDGFCVKQSCALQWSGEEDE